MLCAFIIYISVDLIDTVINFVVQWLSWFLNICDNSLLPNFNIQLPILCSFKQVPCNCVYQLLESSRQLFLETTVARSPTGCAECFFLSCVAGCRHCKMFWLYKYASNCKIESLLFVWILKLSMSLIYLLFINFVLFSLWSWFWKVPFIFFLGGFQVNDSHF